VPASWSGAGNLALCCLSPREEGDPAGVGHLGSLAGPPFWQTLAGPLGKGGAATPHPQGTPTHRQFPGPSARVCPHYWLPARRPETPAQPFCLASPLLPTVPCSASVCPSVFSGRLRCISFMHSLFLSSSSSSPSPPAQHSSLEREVSEQCCELHPSTELSTTTPYHGFRTSSRLD